MKYGQVQIYSDKLAETPVNCYADVDAACRPPLPSTHRTVSIAFSLYETPKTDRRTRKLMRAHRGDGIPWFCNTHVTWTALCLGAD